MTEKNNKSTGRRYDLEYANYQGTEEQKKNRAKRNNARRRLEREGRVHKGDGKDVDHKNGISAGNGDSNLRVRTKSDNRSYPRNKNGGKK
jgi:hypothetical protein